MADTPTITAVVAMTGNNCIGKDGALPWHIPADLKFFKRVTKGKPVIMGRKTFESILASLGKPLPNRENIIVSRSLAAGAYEGANVTATMDEAINLARQKAAEQGIDDIIIGGGAQIYELALPYIDIIYATRVDHTVDGDTFFPELANTDWREDWREDHPGNDPPFAFTRLVRR